MAQFGLRPETHGLAQGRGDAESGGSQHPQNLSVPASPREPSFSPEAVERIQALIKGPNKPARVVETPVYEYS